MATQFRLQLVIYKIMMWVGHNESEYSKLKL